MYTPVRLKFWKTQSHLFGDKLALEMNRLDLTQKRTLRLGGNTRRVGRTVSLRATVTMVWGLPKGAGEPTLNAKSCMPSGPFSVLTANPDYITHYLKTINVISTQKSQTFVVCSRFIFNISPGRNLRGSESLHMIYIIGSSTFHTVSEPDFYKLSGGIFF